MINKSVNNTTIYSHKPKRVALSHSSSADSVSDVHGSGIDDTHNVSQWREVGPEEEIPFEFEAREKLRHRYVL